MSQEIESKEQVAKLIQRLATTPGRLTHAVTNKTPEQLKEKAESDQWSAEEILAHMRASDDIVSARIYMVLTRENSPLLAFDERRWADVARYTDMKFNHSLTLFTLRRVELVSMLQKLPLADWQRTGQHEESGTQTIQEIIQTITEHEEEHCTQLEQLLSKYP